MHALLAPWSRRRIAPVAVAIAVAAAVLASAGTASAPATRFAAPAGSGATCSASAPCSLPVAVSGSAAGDTVTVAGGSYALSGTITVAHDLTIAAADIGDRPDIVTSDGVVFDITAGDVDVDGLRLSSATYPVAVESGAGAVDIRHCVLLGGGVYVNGQSGGDPATTIEDTLMDASTGSSTTLYTIRRDVAATRVTIISANIAARNFSGNTITFADSIIVAPGGFLHGTLDGTIQATYSTVSNTTGLASPGTSHLSMVAPIFRDEAAHDYHPLAGSATVGAADPAHAAVGTDADGYPRTTTPIDQGAYAYRPMVDPVASATLSDVTTTGATLDGAVSTGGEAGTATVTLPDGSTVGKVALTRTSAPQAVHAVLTGLTPATSYTVRLTAKTAAGVTQEDRTLTTLATSGPPDTTPPVVTPPAAVPGPAPAPAPAPAPKPLPAPSVALVANSHAAQLLLDKRAITLRTGCGPVACTVAVAARITQNGKTIARLTAVKAATTAGQAGLVRLRTPTSLRSRLRKTLARHPATRIGITFTATFRWAGSATPLTRTVTVKARRLHG